MIYVYTFIAAGHVEDRRHSQREPVELLIKNCNSVYLSQQRTIMFHSFVYFSVGIKISFSHFSFRK